MAMARLLLLLVAHATCEMIPESLEALQALQQLSQPRAGQQTRGASVSAQGAAADANAAIAAKAAPRASRVASPVARRAHSARVLASAGGPLRRFRFYR